MGAGAVTIERSKFAESHPSSGATRHLPPQGGKEVDGAATAGDAVRSPSPLAGEGARRADEGDPSTPFNRRYKSSARTIGFAKVLRGRSTEAEKQLWSLLRDRRFAGFKFRRQVPLGPYIADFACLDARLIVELDGSQHLDSERDVVRDRWLADDGYRILRVWNGELYDNRSGVLDAIWYALQEPPT